MKKWIVFCIIAALTFAGCAAPGAQFIGKTLAELEQELTLLQSPRSGGYCFGTDKNGDLVVVQYEAFENGTEAVVDVQTLPAQGVSNTPEAFAALKEGMTIYEVVAAVGLPCDRPVTTGLMIHTFSDSNGTEYMIAWDVRDDLLVLGAISKS